MQQLRRQWIEETESPMSPKQRTRLYFPAWRAAFAANWRADRGLVLMLDQPANPDLARQIDTLARQIAERQARKVTGDDLRRVTHLVVLGRQVSSQDLDNRSLDQVLTTFRLLADPDNLQAVIDRDNPQAVDRKRLEYAVRNCGWPEAYVLHVCREKMGTTNWLSLPLDRLHQLVITLKARRRARQRQQAQPLPPSKLIITRPQSKPASPPPATPRLEPPPQAWSEPSIGAFGATYTGD